MVRPSSDPHVRLNRQAGLQQPVRIELLSWGAFKINAYWHALHDFYVVSSGVLWRQQTEDRSCTAAYIGNVRFPSEAVGVQLDFDGLPRVHVSKLRLLEVRCDPDIVKWHHFYQFLPDADVLTHFDRLLANNSCDWRTDDGVSEVKFGLSELRFPLQHLGIGRIRPRTDQRDLLRCSLSTPQIVACLQEVPLRLPNGLFGRVHNGCGRRYGGSICRCCGYRRVILLARNVLLFDKFFIACEVRIAPRRIRFSLLQICFGRLEILLRGLKSSLCVCNRSSG